MTSTNRWNRSQPATPKPEEKLLVFGYSCKVFRDDEKAAYIDQGKHLIPWMGDENLMIDRYDVRGYLHDLSSFDMERDDEEDTTEEEQLCNEERYLALRTNLTEEELYHEEEMKRLRAAVASDGAYHEIGFSYDSIEDSNSEPLQSCPKEEEEDEPYSPPEGFNVPKGMNTPSTMKIHAIIEKTALFISRQGGQMEIIIKMKQSDNPQFAFMHLDNPLHPYYKHLVAEIKSGRYKPVPEKKKEVDEEHHDGHYLHPSLVSGIAEVVPKFTVPSINFVRTGDDSYSLLVKNLKQRVEEDAQRYSPTVEHGEKQTESPSVTDEDSNGIAKPASKGHKSRGSPSDTDDSSSSDESDSDGIVPPPPDVQPVIDKMAEYVAKNGEDFETIVIGKNDKRFEFLKPGSKFYNYYIYRRSLAAKSLCLTEQVKPKDQEPASGTKVEDVKAVNSPASAEIVSKALSEHGESPLVSPHCNSNVEEESSDSEEETTDLDTTVEAKSEVLEVKSPPPVKIKAPICFSLKMKENEVNTLEKTKKASLLLDDSDPEDDAATNNSDPEKKPKQLVCDASSSGLLKKSAALAEVEEKPKKMSTEELEQKIAEEKFRDKLMAAARERMTLNKKEKQLQLERKQKAALFLQMLQTTKIPDSQAMDKTSRVKNSPSNNNSSFSPPPSEITSPEKAIPISSYPPSPISALPASVEQSSCSESESSDLEKVSVNKAEQADPSQDGSKKKSRNNRKRSHSPEKKSSHKSKSHKHSHSKKRKRSRSHSPARKHKSRPSQKDKDKKLPAAYANSRRSRSRSRSPRRYSSHRARPPLPYWNRWRQ